MKQLFAIIVVLCALLIILFATTVSAVAPTETTSVRDIIKRTSRSYGVKTSVMEAVVNCESQFNPLAEGDKINGVYQSFGLVQIYLKYHPEVTKEQALDPYFATAFLADKMQKGQASLWSCYKILYE